MTGASCPTVKPARSTRARWRLSALVPRTAVIERAAISTRRADTQYTALAMGTITSSLGG